MSARDEQAAISCSKYIRLVDGFTTYFSISYLEVLNILFEFPSIAKSLDDTSSVYMMVF